MVEVEIFGQLTGKLPRRQQMTLEHSLPARKLAVRLGLNPNEIGLVVINGKQADMQEEVPMDCRISFFPPLSGG